MQKKKSIKNNHLNITDFLQIDPNKTTKIPEFIDDLLNKINKHITNKGRILILAMTKRSSEEIANFLITKGYKTFYLHSEINTMDRRDIIKKLRSGEIDIIVGVNLLREGIDIPEVSLLAILDADKEGFLRSTTSLIQIIGRAARNPNSEVVLYAEKFTESMVKSLRETYRRRGIQQKYNKSHNIKPKLAHSNIKNLESVKTDEELGQFDRTLRSQKKKLKKITKKEKEMIMKDLKNQMDKAIKEWKFEDAAIIRDQIKEINEM